LELRVDGLAVSVPEGATLLEACDQAGRYVPRLCFHPGLGCPCRCEATAEAREEPRPEGAGTACGLCVVRIDCGSSCETTALACYTAARPGIEVVTDDAGLHAERLDRLAGLLAHHPHICLSCPDRDGCTREECTFGIPAGARCCDEFGRCEFGKLVAFVDAREELPRPAVAVPRTASIEGRIRREPGLCLGCARCVVVCGTSPAAGKALRLAPVEERSGESPPASLKPYRVAVPNRETLRASDCTFCGQCVMVCPTGALTAPGELGARWLEGWRKRTGLPAPVLSPDPWRPLGRDELATVPSEPGVFVLADGAGRVLRIGGVADLSRGIAVALTEPGCASATC